MREGKMIKKMLKETGQAIKFYRNVATLSNFEDMTRRLPMVLHISCHGIKNEPKAFRFNYEKIRDEGDFLLFETQEGGGQLISCK